MSRSGIVFDNHYARLPERFYTRQAPLPVPAPRLFALNEGLAQEMGLDVTWLQSDAGLDMLSGNQVPDGAEPLAQVYAGHQFGGWSGRLGDGRAILLGEVSGTNGTSWDLQLKGSGRTLYSRGGDGRAWLGPVMREYIVSEAMHALGVPTTRALAAVETGEYVLREQRYPGAILTRAASSHVRVGTFQYFAAQRDVDALRELQRFAIERHYPDLDKDDTLGFFKSVIAAQAKLIAQWMGLGFIHGVMNTDNCHIGGLTIDYGPCAFMDDYHPAKVFSSIDQFGRYAYGAQPEIIVWNLAQLATALLPLIDTDQDKAVADAQTALQEFGPAYTQAWQDVFFAKLGLSGGGEAEIALVQDLLTRMAAENADFTLVFRGLLGGTAKDQFNDPASFEDWATDWHAYKPDLQIAASANPAVIPRNHQIEAAIQDGLKGDFNRFNRLVDVFASPFEDHPGHPDLQAAPQSDELVHRTFCGT